MTYRFLGKRGPAYCSLKVSRMDDDASFIIIGITDVHEQTIQRLEASRLQQERNAYARINALSGQFLCVYIVVPETGRYREYSAMEGFNSLALPKEGPDFFTAMREEGRRVFYPDDVSRFLSMFTQEGVLSEIERNGVFSMNCRLWMNGEPKYVQLRVAMVDEKKGRRLVFGINDIDANVRREEEYARRLAMAQNKASIDALTGVKNKHAFLDAETQLNQEIEAGDALEFSVTMLDVNDLKKINDNDGHAAGDQYLREACKIICATFNHSPVFRIGGDEFAVISRNRDYERIDALVEKVRAHNAEALRDGGIVIACGMARFTQGDDCVNDVFKRADREMYNDKISLKASGN